MPFDQNKIRIEDLEILGLELGASAEQVKKAYRKQVKRWHPDRFQQDRVEEKTRAEARFKEVNAAYVRILKATEEGLPPDRDQETGKAAPGGRRTHRESQRRSKPGTGQSAEKKTVTRPSAETFFRHIKGLLTGRNRYYAGLAAGLSLMILGAFLLWQQSPAPPKTVIPPLDSDRFVLILPSAPNAKAGPRSDNNLAGPVLPPSTKDSATRSTPSKGYFGIGSSSDEVLQTQGAPSRIVGNTWSFGLSEVRFRQGRVHGFNNFDGRLKVRLIPTTSCETGSGGFFTLGSTSDQVICAQGTPDRVEGNRWYYGLDQIRFKDGHVAGFNNSYGNLKVRMRPSRLKGSGTARTHFKIGSDKNEVLAAQGTPLGVENDIWFYRFSDVHFSHNRVNWVNDPTGRLHFLWATRNRLWLTEPS